MAAGGHFGRPKITFNLILAISDQYPNLIFFLTLDDRKSLLIAFLGTSDQYLTFFSQNGFWRPFWKTENHF